MPLTIELPPQLGDMLREEADKAGLSPQEHATLLLSLATALLGDDNPTPFRDAVRLFIAQHSLDADQVACVFEELVARCAERKGNTDRIAPRIRDDLQSWRAWYVHQPAANGNGSARPSAMGKYAHVPGTSDDFAREKQSEIEREERRAR